MTPRSLWTILLKCFGLYTLLNSLSVIPQSISSIVMVNQAYSDNTSQNLGPEIGLIILSSAFYLAGVYLFLFKTDLIITRLSLEKHFKDKKAYSV